ncbi:hypothetical protein [Snodgrassella alvi]|uniref:Uncharacterized protein n=1 Tax=Snodgrassella alvi TaxID=1196083 RepID=A0A2N9WVJ5_9NEIS|nr:hypothetical protein [Snodgrassella alvi]PIT15209.1 hypothetical protein BGI34_12090 [Snodgrassella alvi]PIT15337.1 hypothetical protein BGI33_06420 [Snodgrassella alvi]PIT17335.1 hypothetical protein BGI32_02865 [Snodgrassella alvi]
MAANLLHSKHREEYNNHNLIRYNQLLHFRGHHYHYDAEHRLSEVRIEQTDRSQRYGYVIHEIEHESVEQNLRYQG